MVQRSRGFRVKTRSILRNRTRDKGLGPITRYLRDFEEGARVAVVLDPTSHRGMPHPRFQGHTGTVIRQQGGAFLVRVVVGHKPKTVIARPEHLKRVQ